MRTIRCTPEGNNDDGLLTARLFDLALNGDTDSAELNAVEAVVYARLEETYGREEAATQAHTSVVLRAPPQPNVGFSRRCTNTAPTRGSMNNMNSTP